MCSLSSKTYLPCKARKPIIASAQSWSCSNSLTRSWCLDHSHPVRRTNSFRWPEDHPHAEKRMMRREERLSQIYRRTFVRFSRVFHQTTFPLRNLRFFVEKSPFPDASVKYSTKVNSIVSQRVPIDTIDDGHSQGLSIQRNSSQQGWQPIGHLKEREKLVNRLCRTNHLHIHNGHLISRLHHLELHEHPQHALRLNRLWKAHAPPIIRLLHRWKTLTAVWFVRISPDHSISWYIQANEQ